MLLTLFGLCAILTLIVSIPLYVDAVHHSILLDKISSHTLGGEVLPYSFRFVFYGLWSGKNQWENVEPLDTYLRETASSELAMPMLRITRHMVTDLFDISLEDAGESGDVPDGGFGKASFGFLDGIEDNIKIVDGKFPEAAEPDANSLIEVLVSLETANKYGFQPGEEYLLTAVNRVQGNEDAGAVFPVRIAGVWEPENARDPYWIVSPALLEGVFIVPEQTLTERVAPFYDMDISQAIWHLILDGTEINADQVTDLLERIAVYEQGANKYLPNFSMLRSPVGDLRSFQRSAQQLMMLLYIFTIPVVALIMLFVFLMASLSIERRRNEIAVLRSRGASTWQTLSTIVIETLILGLLALGLSYPLGALITQAVGLSTSFMDFSSRTELSVRISDTALAAGLITVLFVSLVNVFPAISAVQHTVISYKQELARQLRKPFWQRIWLDLFLLVPALYGSYLLRNRGNLMPDGSSEPLNDPLLYLVPSLLVLSLTLLLLRILPRLLELIAHLLEQTPSVGILLAVRSLSRTRGYEIPLIILTLTLSLSIYTASLARTLEDDLFARVNYQTGSDVRFIKVGRNTSSSFLSQGAIPEAAAESLSFPVSEYLKVKGITDATRVGYYPVDIRPLSAPRDSGIFIGVERLDFPRMAYWREDFASQPLNNILNSLGAVPHGVLVNQGFLDQTGIRIGDSIELVVRTDLGRMALQSQVVGSFDLFPTWYEEEEGPLFVGNLEYLFDQVGGYAPYQVWAKVSPEFDYKGIYDLQISDFNVKVLSWLASQPKIQTTQNRPEYQGIFGFLFVGFIAAAVMSVVGFLLYAIFSLQRRYVELGVLRANGLSRRQMSVTLAFEILFLILVGALIGTLLGVGTSSFYIPYLQIGDTPADHTPPFLVNIAWDAISQIYILFGALFLVTLFILLLVLQRIKIFQAIKLGETL